MMYTNNDTPNNSAGRLDAENPASEISEENPINESSKISIKSESGYEEEKVINKNLSSIISDIENSQQINDVLVQGNMNDMCCNLSVNPTIARTADTLKTINSIKEELCKLPLEKCENQYITTDVFPIVNILYLLSTSSVNLSNSVNVLTTSPIVHAKKSELKDTIDTIYDMNEDCEDLYKVIHKRLKVLIDS